MVLPALVCFFDFWVWAPFWTILGLQMKRVAARTGPTGPEWQPKAAKRRSKDAQRPPKDGQSAPKGVKRAPKVDKKAIKNAKIFITEATQLI